MIVVMHKNKIIIIILMLFLPQVVISATLDYHQYPEEKIFQGKPAEPNVATHKEAGKYQTILRQQSKQGPNFAGHYTIVTIGCGTSCAGIAVVDAQTGHVYFPQNLHHVFWAGWWHKPYGPEFKLTSRLLIVYGQANSEDAPFGISYFEWTGGEFKLLHFEPRDRGQPPK
jgi:hypothetical protein